MNSRLYRNFSMINRTRKSMNPGIIRRLYLKKQSLYLRAALVLMLAGMAVTGIGCGKKTAPKPPAANPPAPVATETKPAPAPTLTLTATPAAINKGQTTVLSWRTSNATEVVIDGGIGTVEASGSRTISPGASVTFLGRASGPGGTATAEVRITVNEAEPVVPPAARPLTAVEWFATNIKDAFFDYDSYEIGNEARQALIADARALNESDRKNIRITIEGHCDERGSEAYNLSLGDKRANSARDFLISQGVDATRIDVISYGEEKPFALGHDEEAWKQNRRAHLVMR
jgi:peptidoglycan-associated lipoprotein